MSDPFSAAQVFLLQSPFLEGQTAFENLAATREPLGNVGVVASPDRPLFSELTLKLAAGQNYLNIPSGLGNLYPVGTVEGWFWWSDSGTTQVLLYCGTYGSNEPWSILWDRPNSQFYCSQSYGTPFRSNVITPGYGAWHHIALVGRNAEYWFWLDGVQVGYRNSGVSFPDQESQIWVGGTPLDSSVRMRGYMGPLRITKGVALYTEPFTPPTSLFPLPDLPSFLLQPGQHLIDSVDGGSYRITGTVDELGTVGKYRVRLFDRQSARCIRETWSDEAGNYAFDWIAYREKGYFAVAYDHGDNPLNAAIADLITPEPMP